MGCECRHVGPTSEPADASVLSGFRAQGDESVPSRGLLDLGNRVSERANERARPRTKNACEIRAGRTRERVNKTASERVRPRTKTRARIERGSNARAIERTKLRARDNQRSDTRVCMDALACAVKRRRAMKSDEAFFSLLL